MRQRPKLKKKILASPPTFPTPPTQMNADHFNVSFSGTKLVSFATL